MIIVTVDHAWFGIHHGVTVITMLVALILATLAVAMTTSSYVTPPAQLWSIFTDLVSGHGVAEGNSQAFYALTVVRIPRLLLALMVGGCLAVSGATCQGLLRNPMVSSNTLGMAPGASTGAILRLLAGALLWVTQGVAFVFDLGVTAAVLLLGRFIGRGSSKLPVLVLTGVMIPSIFSTFTNLIKYITDSDDKLPAIVFWLMGSFARSGSWNNLIVLAIAMLLRAVPLMLLRHQMSVLSLGEEEARNTRLDVRRARPVIIRYAMILTAVTVTLCGNISWVDLTLPHLMQFVVDPDYRFLLPSCLLASGFSMLVIGNTVRILLPGKMPVGIVTSLIGTPLLVYLLFQGRKDWVR